METEEIAAIEIEIDMDMDVVMDEETVGIEETAIGMVTVVEDGVEIEIAITIAIATEIETKIGRCSLD